MAAAAAVIAADPMPASLENTPLATPYRIERIIDAVIPPNTPPVAAFTLNAYVKIMASPDGTFLIFPAITARPAIT